MRCKISAHKMIDEQRAQLIQKITELREENKHLDDETQKMQERRCELQQFSSSMKSAIADRAMRELEQLDSEQTFISQKCLEDEAFLKREFQAKMARVIKRKEELERQVEAEGEFLCQNLKNRISQTKTKMLDLRAELNEKTKELDSQLAQMTPDEIAKLMIEVHQKASDFIAGKVAESYRELDGLTTRATRLKMIVEKLEEQVRAKELTASGEIPGMKPRRSSNAAPVRERRSSA